MYKCLCCGNETLPVPADAAIAHVCPVCWWENDVFLHSDDEPSDENHGMTLRQAQGNYKKYGICDPNLDIRGRAWKSTFPQADARLGDHAPFLSVLEESPDNELHIKIYAASVGELKPEMLDGLSAPVGAVVSKCRPIQPSGLVIDIRFEDYILYQVRNESYAAPSRKEARHGKYLLLYEKSLLLDYLSTLTSACQGGDGSYFPDPWTHYGICTQNQVIDVISHRAPVLTVRQE